MKKCAFLTMDDDTGYVIDDRHAHPAMVRAGWNVTDLSWRQTEIPWAGFDLVVIRSTWDYPPFVDEFFQVLEIIDAETTLANPIETVRWNLSKTYLGDLQKGGVGIVPTIWSTGLEDGALERAGEQLSSSELVVKPTVGANGVDAFRLSPPLSTEQSRELAELFRGRSVMIQPFMANVVSEGEYSLFYFNGSYSHAILKTPAENEFRSQEERGAEIQSVDPEPLLAQRGLEAIASVAPTPLYARVDFVRSATDDYQVMEMELIEPSMYLRMDEQAPDRFAQAISRWFEASQS